MAGQKHAPLEVFDARIVQTPLQGLLRNMDSELARLLKQAMTSHNGEAERRLSLFLIMLRFTKNSYEAVSFLCSDSDDAPKRKREFALILPPTNRQLLDLLFTLVFMLDEFPARSMAYELSGYRQAREEYNKFQARYGTHPKWQAHLLTLREWLPTMEKYFSITSEQKANPAQIKYWRAPYNQEPTVHGIPREVAVRRNVGTSPLECGRSILRCHIPNFRFRTRRRTKNNRRTEL